MPRKKKTATERVGWRPEEWGARYGFSRSYSYKLIRLGRGPRAVRVGDGLLITREADEEWRESLPARDAERDRASAA